MATLIDHINKARIEGCYATTNSSASSYNIPVWVDPQGEAYIQVDANIDIYTVDLEADKIWQDLADQIKDRRLMLSITNQWLSKASGVGTASISRLEKGGPANIDTICRIASCLGCKLQLVPITPEQEEE